MFSVDDLMDLCVDAVTRGPDDPVPQPLFEAIADGERETLVRRDGGIGIRQKFIITDVGEFYIAVFEKED